jgi:hypothetical protein
MDADPKAAPGKSRQCRNCGAEAPDAYCPRCGQETNEHLPTAREFVHEFVLHYVAAEGQLWRTLAALVLHPGKLTLEYIRGRKRTYVLPLRLYLTVSVVFFLALNFVAAPATERVSAAFHRSLNNGRSTFTIVDLGFGGAIRNPDGSFTCDLPKWMCERIDERVIKPQGELERRAASIPTELFAHLSTAVFILLPVFAFYLQLAYFKRSYGEHFLFALHVYSFWFVVLLALLVPLPGWIQMGLEAYLVIYSVAALRAVYRSSWLTTALKAIAVGAAYAVSLFIATTLISVWTLMK